MANSTFPVRCGAFNFGNSKLARAIANGAIPWAWDGGLFWYTQRVLYSDLSAAATTKELDLHTLNANNLFPANVTIEKCRVENEAAFDGGAISALTVEVGRTGDVDSLLTSTSINTLAGDETDWKETLTAAELRMFKAAMIPTFKITATGANTDALTTGSAVVHIGFLPRVYGKGA